MFGIGPMELVVILVMALLVLGPKRMPELARTLGRGLGEFRRASNDLRQSLALDDLQNELRDGLTGANAMKKPGGAGDRPAQAGDDLPPGETPEGDPGQVASANASDSSDSSDSSDKAGDTAGGTGGGTGDAAGEGALHPGELPLDADPYEHHDDSTGDSTRDTNAASAPPTTDSARTTGSRPADSPLGNVPVGGSEATHTASSPTASQVNPARPQETDKERG